MLGAIVGDVIGSVYERNPVESEDFPIFRRGSTFTDDTVLTVAIAEAILDGSDYETSLRTWGQRYRGAGYGRTFRRWIVDPAMGPYNSFGNGSAMRVSPVGWAFDTVESVLDEAARSASVTHNHPEGIKGAQAVALAIFLARRGVSKEEIRAELAERFGYDLTRSLEEIRPAYRFDVTCQGSVPESLTAFIESDSVEDAIRKAISLGGDADTMAAIAGSVAHAFYGSIPPELVEDARACLTSELCNLVDRFCATYMR